ncbi:XRE family transcriptional regulator [Mycolicibacterium sp. CH28]|uniref:helix-turn-helix domain-containing protein n=1 Tax=Mycolicibacterium sp. CH28 TaxID=2512237 RepID=UPI001080261E|nr:helix-turn-helix transcriptional regulator [Mycolicibacterium sp. CH28]TGD84307.1 XRE family transcriptional regulator [Mycolicibacterium sp. CH28]
MRLQSGDTLRALIRQRGYSMAQVARCAGCSKAFMHGLCSGAKQSCSIQLGQRIAEILDVPFELLFAMNNSRRSGRRIKQKLTA